MTLVYARPYVLQRPDLRRGEVYLLVLFATLGMMVMVSAMQKADSVDPKKYLPELQKTSYDGVTGHIAFDAHGDIKDGALTLYTFKDGQRSQIAVVK